MKLTLTLSKAELETFARAYLQGRRLPAEGSPAVTVRRVEAVTLDPDAPGVLVTADCRIAATLLGVDLEGRARVTALLRLRPLATTLKLALRIMEVDAAWIPSAGDAALEGLLADELPTGEWDLSRALEALVDGALEPKGLPRVEVVGVDLVYVAQESLKLTLAAQLAGAPEPSADDRAAPRG